MEKSPSTSSIMVASSTRTKLRPHLAHTSACDFIIRCPEHLPKQPTEHANDVIVSSDSESASSTPYTNVESAFKIHEFNVHSYMLAKFDMFRASLDTPMRDEHHERSLLIPDFDAKVVNKFIDFVYEDEIDELDNETAIELIKLADYYNISELKELCGVVVSAEAARRPIEFCELAHKYKIRILLLDCDVLLQELLPSYTQDQLFDMVQRIRREWIDMHALMLACQAELAKRLSHANALQYLKFAYENNCSSLFTSALGHFKENWDDMLQTYPKDIKVVLEWMPIRARLFGAKMFLPQNNVSEATRECHWVPYVRRNGVPPNAVSCGLYRDGRVLHIGRARFNGFIIPGYVTSDTVYFSFGGAEHEQAEFEVLVEHQQPAQNAAGDRESRLSWQRCTGDTVPPNAVYGGKQQNEERLFIGRHEHAGCLLAGKVHVSNSALYVGYGGEEWHYNHFEVLVVG